MFLIVGTIVDLALLFLSVPFLMLLLMFKDSSLVVRVLGMVFYFAVPALFLLGPATAWRLYDRQKTQKAVAAVIVPVIYAAFVALVTGPLAKYLDN